MASITSLTNSSSSTSSIYGNRNVISGLASGMDTESMIENSISGYKTKITTLQQRMTKMQWKQDAYRSMITQMNNILSKYTSYTSSTNLFSPSFFSKAVNTVAGGANAAAVSATGKSSSNVAINRIKQLAEAASYTVGTSGLVSEGSKTDKIEWNEKVPVSNVSGSISLKYGGGKTGKGSTFTLRFDETEVYNSPEELAKAINEKLKDKTISSGGDSSAASEYIEAKVQGGKVVLEDQRGNYFEITSVSGDMAKLFEKGEAETVEGSSKRGFASKAIATYKDGKLESSGVELADKSKTAAQYLVGKSLNVTLDGKSKSIKLDDIFADSEYKTEMASADTDAKKSAAFAKALQKQLGKEFGTGKIKVSADADTGALKIEGPKGNGSTLRISGSNDIVNKALGLGEGGFSNTLQTSWTLEKALGKNITWTESKNEKNELLDKDGNVTTDPSKVYKTADITVNGKKFTFSSTDTVKDLMDKINGDEEAGVEIKYSSMTGNFAITAKETGEASRVNIGGELGQKLFGISEQRQNRINEILWYLENDSKFNPDDIKNFSQADYDRVQKELASYGYKAGQDAIFSATINGETMNLTRSSNTVDLDGMQVTLNKTFGYNADGTVDNTAEKITFTTSSDSDKIVDAVKSFVEDYNKLVTEIHNAYRTEALKNSSGKSYEPLTDDDMSGMSESSIKAYEDKAKTGILFGDQDVSNLYSRLTEAVQSTGAMGSTLRSIGINVEFSNGLSTINLDEDALRSALESDPDRVKDAFTQTTANGASQNGLMAGLKSTLEMYGNTSIANPGILVNKAGTELSSYSLSHNEMQDQLDSIQEQIEKWQEKMSDRVDYYTNKFTQLEQLINQMNSQSSMLSGMMGG